MAQPGKKNQGQDNYKAAVAKLQTGEPERLYLLYGEEDYLREHFMSLLRKKCLEPAGEEFNHKLLRGPALDLNQLEEAVNAVPFFAERTLVEVRDFDFNRCTETSSNRLKQLITDIPDYCTLVFVVGADYDLDGRKSAIKAVKKQGQSVEFVPQSGDALLTWINRRFRALGKQIARPEAEQLVFFSGQLMSGLIPEIEKVASYAKGEQITSADIEAVAHHIPEAVVFSMTDALGAQDYNRAAGILQELLQMRDEPPIKLLAVIGQQMRNLYAARLTLDKKLGRQYLMKTAKLRYDFLADKLLRAAKQFSLQQLEADVRACAECDYAMKSSGADDRALLCQLFAQLAMEGAHE